MRKTHLAILAAALLIGYIGTIAFITENTSEIKALDIPPIQTVHASPAVDMFLKIGDIKGEARDTAHKEEIDVLSWSWGMSQSGTFSAGGGMGAGKVTVQDISFTKYIDKSSPQLMQACAEGKHIPEAKLIVRKAGDKPLEYLKITMTDVLVTSVSTGGSAGEDIPTENVTLNFAKVKVEYTEQDETGNPKGTTTMGWDIAANKKLGQEATKTGSTPPPAVGAPPAKAIKAKITLSEAGSTIFEVNAEDKTFDVKVIAEGIESLAFSQDERTITLENDGTEGAVEVEIPKELLGGEFTVMADEQRLEFDESETEAHSVLLFDAPADSSMIAIQGTTVVPEFPLAMIVLTGTTGLVLFYGISNRNRLMRRQVLGVMAVGVLLIGYTGMTAFVTQSASEIKAIDIPPIQTVHASPAVDMFLKIGDVKGEARDTAHKEEIDVLSWSWGMSQSGTMSMGSGGGAGKVNVKDFSITKYIDKSSPQLMQACAEGKHIPEATFVVRKAGDKPLEYLKITMTDVLVTSVSTGGSAGEDIPTETVSINFSKFKVEYVEQDEAGTPKGTVQMGWDLAANKKL